MQIKPYANNAKEHPKKQVELIAKSISRFGWQQPIKVGKDNIILAGHGRNEAYETFKDKYPMKEPWIINEEGKTISGEAETRKLTPKEEIAYRLADNQINALSGNDIKLVVQDLKELDTELIDLTGFDTNLILDKDEKDTEIDLSDFDDKYYIKFEYNDNEEYLDLMEKLEYKSKSEAISKSELLKLWLNQ